MTETKKEVIVELIDEPNADDPVLCYVSHGIAYFTTRRLDEQWGDDWNDRPYEHNAGKPSRPYLSASRPSKDENGNWLRDGSWDSLTQWNNGKPGYRVFAWRFSGDWREPWQFLNDTRGNDSNSPFSVDDINRGHRPIRIPWMASQRTNPAGVEGWIRIYPGCKLSYWLWRVKSLGNEVQELTRQEWSPDGTYEGVFGGVQT